MTKPKQEVVVRPTEKEVATSVAELVARTPGALSYDPADPANELLHVEMMTDPGCPSQLREGWSGIVSQWAVGTYDMPNEQTAELETLPSIYLKCSDGRSCRLFGWPAISSWALLMRTAGMERMAKGLPVVVRKRLSGTAGRSYWVICVDTGAAEPGTDGRLPTF
jgi:hypothetical protein